MRGHYSAVEGVLLPQTAEDHPRNRGATDQQRRDQQTQGAEFGGEAGQIEPVGEADGGKEEGYDLRPALGQGAQIDDENPGEGEREIGVAAEGKGLAPGPAAGDEQGEDDVGGDQGESEPDLGEGPADGGEDFGRPAHEERCPLGGEDHPGEDHAEEGLGKAAPGMVEEAAGGIAQIELHRVVRTAAHAFETEDAVIRIVDAGRMEPHGTGLLLDAVIDPATADADLRTAAHLQQRDAGDQTDHPAQGTEVFAPAAPPQDQVGRHGGDQQPGQQQSR